MSSTCMPGRSPSFVDELRRRLAAADMKLVDRRQILDRQVVGVLAHGDQRVEDRALEIAVGVVLGNAAVDAHRTSAHL